MHKPPQYIKTLKQFQKSNKKNYTNPPISLNYYKIHYQFNPIYHLSVPIYKREMKGHDRMEMTSKLSNLNFIIGNLNPVTSTTAENKGFLHKWRHMIRWIWEVANRMRWSAVEIKIEQIGFDLALIWRQKKWASVERSLPGLSY